VLHFFKTKSYLKDIIPSNFVDIHSHLLPGIDDGAKTIEETKSLVASLQGFGFEQFITTPHIMQNVWNNTTEIITSKLKATLPLLQDSLQLPKMKAAAEYMMDSYFTENCNSKVLLPLKDNYVLVEMSYLNAPIQLYQIIFDVQIAGYIPILAHPERYNFYHSNYGEFKKLKNSGCLFQLNLLSTVGYYGANVTKTATQLLKDGMIDFVGSDVHHQNHVAAFSEKLLLKDINPLKEAIEKNQFFRF
jgi:tyrosine-protein phosphatase YwqE